MPDRMAQRTENITAMTWLMGLPNLLGKWKILDMSLSALSLAYIGDMHGNKQTSRQGEHFYNQALQHMRGQLARNQIDEGMLAACICMSIYEVCSFPIPYVDILRLTGERSFIQARAEQAGGCSMSKALVDYSSSEDRHRHRRPLT